MAIAATQKWYAGAAAASLAVVAGGWFLLVSPQKANVDDITAQTAAVDRSNQTTEMQIGSLKAEFSQLPQLQSQVALIRQRIPSGPNEPTLLRTLSKTASSAGVTLASVTLAAPAAVPGSTTATAPAGTTAFATPGQVSLIAMSMNFTGNFADTRLFLNSLESMQRVMLVTGISIQRGTTATGGTTLQTALTARVFMANPGAPTVSAGQSTTAVTSTTSPS
jgi:Tfp pilus assembly protein PilO